MKITQLFEADQISAAFAFGRFNPAHQGHIAVWNAVEKISSNWYIGTNPATMGANDPLPFDVKSAWMEEIYPPLTGHIVSKNTVLELAAYIFKKLRSNENAVVAYITDAEDWAWSGKLLNQYNGVEGAHGYYKFANIIHEPSPRVSSATALREAARADNRAAFYQASGTDPKLRIAGKTYFDTVREYMLPYMQADQAKATAKAERDRIKAEKERLQAEKQKKKSSVTEVSDATKQSYRAKAASQVKELEPHAKQGEYKDIAQRAIDCRNKGLARAEQSVAEHIVKHGEEYRILSKKSGKNMGTFSSRAAAEKHEREIEYFKHAKESVEEDEAKTVAKIWDQMTSKEKSSGVKGRTVWNERTQRYYTVFDVPIKAVDEASLTTMRDYFAGDTDAHDPLNITKQREYYSKNTDPTVAVKKDFRSHEEYDQWLKQNDLKAISKPQWSLLNKKVK